LVHMTSKPASGPYRMLAKWKRGTLKVKPGNLAREFQIIWKTPIKGSKKSNISLVKGWGRKEHEKNRRITLVCSNVAGELQNPV